VVKHQKDSQGLDLTYDYPRAMILLGLEKKYGITTKQSDHRAQAMDFELWHDSKSIRLSIHESTGKKGFWGIGGASVEYLNEANRWLLVLLLLRNDKYKADGWLISKQQWLTIAQSLSIDQKGNYKINRHNLVEDEKLSGIAKIIDQIAGFIKKQ
jgi:hypothetical protein